MMSSNVIHFRRVRDCKCMDLRRSSFPSSWKVLRLLYVVVAEALNGVLVAGVGNRRGCR
jgi:hypothetical protein